MLTKKQVCSQIKSTRCTAQQKGLGGCAFDGAQIVLVPITDAAHLVHGSADCTGNSWNTRGSKSSDSSLYKRCFTTSLSETDIIFGSEEKLKNAIEYIAKHYTPSAIFVYTTCVPAMTGEDIVLVCRESNKKLDIPVIPVESPGYAGSKNFGNRIAGETLLEYVIGTKEPTYTTSYDLNLIGEYNIAGELWHITRLFKKLNIHVSSVMTGDSKYQDIASSHRAKLNVMVCSRALLNIAEGMRERYKIPFIEESFFGVTNTSNALRNIALSFNDSKLIKLTDNLIEEEEEGLKKKLTGYKKILKGKRVLIYTGGVKSWSVISALKDLGMKVAGCGIRKSTDKDISKITQLLDNNAVLIENTSPGNLLKLANDLNVAIIVAGGRNQYTSIKAKIPYLDINQDREVAYTGYEGMINLARMLTATLTSPVWKKPGRNNEKGREEEREKNFKSDVVFPRSSLKDKPLTINPLKGSQATGAVIAFLGINNSIPLMHGCQGCTAFVKAILNRHFREPAYVHTTALMETDVIMDGDTNIVNALNKIIDKQKPEMIGLITTGLTEVKGDDISGVIDKFNKRSMSKEKTNIIPVSAPDYKGSMQDGFSKAVISIIESSIFLCEKKEENRINLLVGSFLVPADIVELKEIIGAFGLIPIVLPDISATLGGYLEKEVSFIAKGGTSGNEINKMGSSLASISIGTSMLEPAHILKQKTGVKDYHFDSLFGLDSFDEFINLLSYISGKPIPEKYKRERRQLADVMLDTHFYISRKRFALALEPDLLWNVSCLILETGGEISLIVSPVVSDLFENIKSEKIIQGDLDDLERNSADADIIISNSNATYTAKKLNVPLLRIGFPVVDRLGMNQKVSIGYRGAMNLLFEIGNIFIKT